LLRGLLLEASGGLVTKVSNVEFCIWWPAPAAADLLAHVKDVSKKIFVNVCLAQDQAAGYLEQHLDISLKTRRVKRQAARRPTRYFS